jgi:hypothetical protein
MVIPRKTSSEMSRSRVVGTAGVPASAALADTADSGTAELVVAADGDAVVLGDSFLCFGAILNEVSLVLAGLCVPQF